MTEEIDIDVVDLLHRLGINRIERSGQEVWYSCPFPGHKHGDAKQSASMRIDAKSPWKTFLCLGCGAKGDAANLVARVEGVSRIEAKEMLRQWYGVTYEQRSKIPVIDRLRDYLRPREQEDYMRPLVEIDERFLQEFCWVDWNAVWDHIRVGKEVPWRFSYMFSRGFMAQTLEEWEIGLDPMSEMITIPYRDDQGRVVGFKGRSWEKDARVRYRVLGDKDSESSLYGFPTFDVSQVLFGAWRARMNPGQRLIICEGELNAMMLYQYGHRRVTGISGQTFTKIQARIARSIADEFVLMFDEDEKALYAASLLKPAHVYIVPERDRDACEMLDEEAAWYLDNAISATVMQLRVT